MFATLAAAGSDSPEVRAPLDAAQTVLRAAGFAVTDRGGRSTGGRAARRHRASRRIAAGNGGLRALAHPAACRRVHDDDAVEGEYGTRPDIALGSTPKTNLPERKMKPSNRPCHHGFETRSATHGEAEYTCPVHLHVRHRRLSSCPICGMALELVETRPEDSQFSRRVKRFFWVSLALKRWWDFQRAGRRSPR